MSRLFKEVILVQELYFAGYNNANYTYSFFKKNCSAWDIIKVQIIIGLIKK